MAHVQQSAAVVHVNSADSTSITLNGVTAGSALWLGTATYTGATAASGVTSTGDTWTRDYEVAASGDGNGRLQAFRAENVASGTHAVTINPTGASADISAELCEITSTPTSATSDGTPNATSATGTAATSPSITIAAGSLLIGHVTHVGAGTVSITETYTLLGESEATSQMPLNAESRGDGATLAAGSYTLAWTLGSSQNYVAGVSGFLNSGGGGGGGLPFFLQGDLLTGGMQAKAGGLQ